MLALSANRRAELLVRTQLGAAPLAFDGECRREAGVAGRTARAQLAVALRADGRELCLPVLEVPLDEAALDAHGDPVTEHLAPLLA